MSAAKHTPGPWVASATAVWSGNKPVAGVLVDDPDCYADERMVANARLIAAAPELLDELRYLVEIAEAAMRAANRDGGEYDIGEMLEAPRAAILKATGEQA